MLQATDSHHLHRQEWINRVVALADQIKKWSQSQGWAVEEDRKTIVEELLGEYTAPVLHINAPGGTLHFNPIALQTLGGDGRVDLEAFPTLSRVKLLGLYGEWKVMTDSNIPLRVPLERGNLRTTRVGPLELTSREMTRFEAHQLLSRVRDELESARFALATVARTWDQHLLTTPPQAGKAMTIGDLRRRLDHIEVTYIMRLFAAFEAVLRDYWIHGVGRTTEPWCNS